MTSIKGVRISRCFSCFHWDDDFLNLLYAITVMYPDNWHELDYVLKYVVLVYMYNPHILLFVFMVWYYLHTCVPEPSFIILPKTPSG